MSEYQYYEWQAVDKLLTEAEQDAVGRLSSHIDVSPSRAVVTYSWGDFKHDPRQDLARFFDAHLCLANWGSRLNPIFGPSVPVSSCNKGQVGCRSLLRIGLRELEP